MVDTHLVYRIAHGSSRAARRIYQKRYPHPIVLNRQTFVRVHEMLCELGNDKNSGAGGSSFTWSWAYPYGSTRTIAQLNISHFTVWETWRDHQLYPHTACSSVITCRFFSASCLFYLATTGSIADILFRVMSSWTLVLPPRLNAKEYRNFLEFVLPDEQCGLCTMGPHLTLA